MFTTLHELAKKATLMITIAAEGDGQLRVNVTPMPFDTKAKSNLPQPLSLLATPAEFDADFIAALGTWQAPKRSLIQQAQDAAGGTAPAAGAPALPAPKVDAKSDGKTDKPTRKARGSKGGEDDKKDVVPEAAVAADSPAAAADQVMADTAQPDDAGQASGQAALQAEDEAAGGAGAAGDAHAASEAAGDAAPAAGQDAAPAPAPTEDAGQAVVDVHTLDLF